MIKKPKDRWRARYFQPVGGFVNGERPMKLMEDWVGVTTQTKQEAMRRKAGMGATFTFVTFVLYKRREVRITELEVNYSGE